MKLKDCAVCGRFFWAKRTTAKYCDATCRKRASRGQTADYYAQQGRDKQQHMAALIAQHEPRIYQRLEAFRDKHGQRALNDMLAILVMVSESELAD